MRVFTTSGNDPRTMELIYYFIRKLGGDLGRTKLVKLAYLTDLFARMTLGEPVTNYRYQLFENGPFDPMFYDTVSTLEKNNCIEERFVKDYNGHRYTVKGSSPEAGHLSNEEQFIAERVLEDFGRLPLEVLLDDVVYKTEPARKARDAGAVRSKLDMEACNNRIKNQLGLDLSTFLASKAAFARGERMRLEDVIDSLG